MRSYEVQKRNGHHAVDEYEDGQMKGTVITGISRKLAYIIASACLNAYINGWEAGRKDLYAVVTDHLQR